MGRIWFILVIVVTMGERSLAQIPAQRVPTTSTTQPVRTETQKIERLIQYVSSLDGAVFIRNGTNYTPAEAAEHMRTKWQAAKGQITTAKQFIELAASRSSLSGQEYRVLLKDGGTVTSRELLSKELDRLGSSPDR